MKDTRLQKDTIMGAIEEQVMYWCDTCSRFIAPDHNHTGETRACRKVKEIILNIKPVVVYING